MYYCFQWLSIGTALVAVAFWFAASLVKTPAELRVAFDIRDDGIAGDLADLTKGVAKQGQLNSYAALLTALALLFQSVSFAFQR